MPASRWQTPFKRPARKKTRYAMSTMIWLCRDRALSLGGRPLVMGIVNVTPDSFSDGGQHATPEAAVAHGMRLLEEGADILDVGGESTRPGAAPVPEAEEAARVVPVIAALSATGAVISVDTTKAGVARRAVAAGAYVINDVSAMTHDAAMPAVARESGAGVVLMHMKGEPRTMQANPQYEDVTAEAFGFLRKRVAASEAAGLRPESLVLDPGIGFGKALEHNLQLLRDLPTLAAFGRPVLVGLSRKSFVGRLTGRDVGGRLAGSLAALAYAVLRGAHIVRVHDVQETVEAVRVLAALTSGGDQAHGLAR